MPITVSDKKWILYKHTCDYELIKQVAIEVKNFAAARINNEQRRKMQVTLAEMDMYSSRVIKEIPLDSINHRINTLEFYMFGYETKKRNDNRFIFSPLGNLFLSNLAKKDNLEKIFTCMLFGVQFPHWANTTPSCIRLFPFRLLFKLMCDSRLDLKLYSTEYAHIICRVNKIDANGYNDLVNEILDFRKLSDKEKFSTLKTNEHLTVNAIYEWQYYTQNLLQQAGVIEVFEGDKIGKLFHPQKPTSKSKPTGRWVKNGYCVVSKKLFTFIEKLLEESSPFESTISLSSDNRMQFDIVKEIYSYYPDTLIDAIGDKKSKLLLELLKLPDMIEEYSRNPNNSTSSLFEDSLEKGFNLFHNVEAKVLAGAGNTDLECLYIDDSTKFAVEAKSTANKLLLINSNRLRSHRAKIGAKYTIVITPRYVPAAKADIEDEDIVIILSHTFCEYIQNHIAFNVRDMDYSEINNIVINNLGTDISEKVSELTLEKFASDSD